MIPNRELSYEERCEYLNLETLERRRKKAGDLFISCLIKGEIDSIEIINQMSFNTLTYLTRSSAMLKESFHRTDYGGNNPLSRLIRNFNIAQEAFDFQFSKDNINSRLRALNT